MKKPTFLLALLVTIPVFAVGSTENSTSRHEASYVRDEKWWKCNVFEPTRGCDTGTFAALDLTKEEETFVKEKLDLIAWRPHKIAKKDVAKLLGAKPTIDVGLSQTYLGVGPGSDPRRGVVVYYYNTSVYQVHWYQPGRFLLVKASTF